MAADIRVQKTASVPTSQTVGLGQTVEFRVVATNLGPDAATGLVVSDTAPAGTQLVSATPSQGSYNTANGQWSIGSLSSGSSVTLVMSVRLTAEGVAYNQAQVTQVDQPDPNPANNMATACVSVPVKVCPDDQVTLSIPAGFTGVQWFRDGQLLTWGHHQHADDGATGHLHLHGEQQLVSQWGVLSGGGHQR